jgi:hypothetical protein
MKKIIKKKKKVSSRKMQKGTIGNFFVFGVLGLLIVAGITAIGGFPATLSPQTGTQVQIVTPTANPSHNTLQLDTFGFTTIAPTLAPTQAPANAPTSAIKPTTPVVNQPVNQPVDQLPNDGTFPASPPGAPICQDDDDGVIVSSSCKCADLTVECVNGQPENITSGAFGALPVTDLITCGTAPYAANGRYCVGKPVIYLYPTVPTYVNVQVATSGSIVVSNPTYPAGGWKNILAYPNGTFQYQNQTYSELFYESSVTNFQKPEQGIVIPTSELTENLNGILGQLGLVGNEKKEFISFWKPRLEALNTPYIFFSVLSPSAKDAIDHVMITPKPTTQIAFIAYFKPINTPTYGSSLKLPPTPQRIGFTSVEWGGVIDK